MSGPKFAMMREATQEIREVDLSARQVLAEKRAARKVAKACETFVAHTTKRYLDVTQAVAEVMFQPAAALLERKYAKMINEDVEDLERTRKTAEEWHFLYLKEHKKAKTSRSQKDEDGTGPGGGDMGFTGVAGVVGLALLASACKLS
jgi:hypothetical protein